MTATQALVSVVDDDESVRESLPDLLRAFGFAAQAFSSAEEFLASEFVDQTKCLILDVAMPGMSGPALQEELSRRSSRIPIVFITAHADDTVRPRVLEAGAVECLLKPFSVAALRTAVTTALRVPAVPTTPIVFVVDDDVSVRESLQSLIAWAGWKAETFSSARDFLARPVDHTPSCLVLDVELPDLNGLDLQERIAAERSDLPIIFITGHGDIPMTVRAMKAGAAEFLTKPFERDVLLNAIRRAIERSRVALMQSVELKAIRHRYASLTPREREVFVWVVSGLLNKQVGAELGMTEATVKAHRGQVMQKMHADSLADLVRIAAKLELPLPSRSSSGPARRPS